MNEEMTTWFRLDVQEDPEEDFIVIEAMAGDTPTGAAVVVPFEAAPALANGLLQVWCEGD